MGIAHHIRAWWDPYGHRLPRVWQCHREHEAQGGWAQVLITSPHPYSSILCYKNVEWSSAEASPKLVMACHIVEHFNLKLGSHHGHCKAKATPPWLYSCVFSAQVLQAHSWLVTPSPMALPKHGVAP